MTRRCTDTAFLVRSRQQRQAVAEGEYDFPRMRERSLRKGVPESASLTRELVRPAPKEMTPGQRKRLLRDLCIKYCSSVLSERELAFAFGLAPSKINQVKRKYDTRPQS